MENLCPAHTHPHPPEAHMPNSPVAPDPLSRLTRLLAGATTHPTGAGEWTGTCATRLATRDATRSATPGFRFPPWGEPQATLEDMLLTEPGSRIDGPTEDVMRVVFESAWVVLNLTILPEDVADATALKLLQVTHEQLTQAGYVVRQYPGED